MVGGRRGGPRTGHARRWRHFASNILLRWEASGAGHTTKLLNNFLNAVSSAATAEVMVAGKKAGLDLALLLEVFNKSSGVNFATLNRFPKIITGDYLKGGLTNTLMMKDVVLYSEMVSQLSAWPAFNASGPLASFGLARSLGYADQISNTVVDAIGEFPAGSGFMTKERMRINPAQEARGNGGKAGLAVHRRRLPLSDDAGHRRSHDQYRQLHPVRDGRTGTATNRARS